MDIRVAYSSSLYFSEQLSCIKFFHPTYGLKDINFYSLNQFIEFLLLLKSNIIQNSDVDPVKLTEGSHMSASAY